MDYLYIITPLAAFALIQSIKAAIDLAHGEFSWRQTLHYGGMPSAHTGTVMALALIIALRLGTDNVAFAVVIVFGAMVISDALGIRRFLSDNALILQQLLQREPLLQQKRLRLRFGHSLPEVAVGGLLGAMVALTAHFWF